MDKIEYKAQWNNIGFVKVSKNFPSTQTCSKCRKINSNVGGMGNLGIRDWICPKCGTHHNRDVNAAINILNNGLEIVGTTMQ